MSRDILDQPIVTQLVGPASLESTEPDKSRICYQLNCVSFTVDNGGATVETAYVVYTRREARAVAFAILIEESGNLPTAIQSALVSVLLLVRHWWQS